MEKTALGDEYTLRGLWYEARRTDRRLRSGSQGQCVNRLLATLFSIHKIVQAVNTDKIA